MGTNRNREPTACEEKFADFIACLPQREKGRDGKRREREEGTSLSFDRRVCHNE